MESPDDVRLASRVVASVRIAIGLLGVSVALAACTSQKSAAATPTKSGSGPASDSQIPAVLATIGDDKITLTDIRSRVGDQLDMLEARYLAERYKVIDGTLQTVDCQEHGLKTCRPGTPAICANSRS